MSKLIILCSFIFILLIGCTNNMKSEATPNENTLPDEIKILSDEVNSLKDKVIKLESGLNEKTNVIKQLEQNNKFLKSQQKARFEELTNETNINEILIKNSPYIKHKQGFMKDIVVEGSKTYFILDYAQWAPSTNDESEMWKVINEDEEEDKVEVHTPINNEVPIYIVKNAKLEYQPFKNFKQGDHKGLYNYYIIDDKIVLVTEQLLP